MENNQLIKIKKKINIKLQKIKKDYIKISSKNKKNQGNNSLVM